MLCCMPMRSSNPTVVIQTFTETDGTFPKKFLWKSLQDKRKGQAKGIS